MIRFLLNDQLQGLDGVAPSLSVLQYLRTMIVRTGTKEGCAAGDCGACTVVVGELIDDALHYKAVNSCITPVGTLHGKQLITVEHLQTDAGLHPVQQAMVDCHGSQCGFCTPGIVMSLFAWWQQIRQGTGNADRHGVEIALSGNLCRCTGYAPIVRAAEQSLSIDGADTLGAQREQVIAQLQSLRGEPGQLTSGSQQFVVPDSSQAVARLLAAHPQAQLVAGATDLGLEFTQQLKQPDMLIYTGNVKELNALEETDGALIIGGAVTYSRLQPLLQGHFPAFAQLLDRLGSLQIRNQGTLGGNVANASPIGDTPPVLLALNARVNLHSDGGSRSIPIESFFTGYRKTVMAPGEFIESIVIPKLQDGDVLRVYKISKRFDDDISAVCLALWLQFEGDIVTAVRIGCGGMAATPARAFKTEQALLGRPFDAAAVTAARQALAEDFSPIDDVRASAAYRIAVAGNLLTRARLEREGAVDVNLFSANHESSVSGGVHHA